VLRLHARDDVELGKAADLGRVRTLDVLHPMPSVARGAWHASSACMIAGGRRWRAPAPAIPRSLAMRVWRASLSGGPQRGASIVSVAFIGSSIEAVFDSTTPSAKALTIRS